MKMGPALMMKIVLSDGWDLESVYCISLEVINQKKYCKVPVLMASFATGLLQPGSLHIISRPILSVLPFSRLIECLMHHLNSIFVSCYSFITPTP